LDLTAPPLKTRLACLLYEGMLVLGLAFGAALVFSIATQQKHALVGRPGMQAWLFFWLALYFTWFWSRGRQTLPMKTWHIRLVDEQGQAPTLQRALMRFLLSWLWCLPGLVLAWAFGGQHWAIVAFPSINFVVWAWLTRSDPQGQYLHDRLAGTRLVPAH
jgi:uncharacterized RDD family membrane protein YckC